MKIQWAGPKWNEVFSREKKYVVDLDEKKCDYGSQQISGFPCPHVLRCLYYYYY